MTPRTLIEPARLAGEAVLRSQADDRLVDLVRAGNDRAFEAIVHRYRRPLMRYCARLLTGTRAEDAVQQAFLNAYRAIKADERRIDLRPWLYRIAHNAALNALRGAAADGEQPISEEIDGVERPDQAYERREKLAHVVAAVQALPPRQRDAIVLHELEGRSYEQIATELNVSGGAVRQLLSRARTTLRAGATAIVPEALVFRLASSGGGGEPLASRVAELIAAGGGAAALAKVGTAVVVAGAVAAGAVEAPLGLAGDGSRSGSSSESTRRASFAPRASAPSPGASQDPTGATRPARSEPVRRAARLTNSRSGESSRRSRRRGRENDTRQRVSDRRDDDDDRSGSGSGGSGSDRSGSGREEAEDRGGRDEDRSGHGGGGSDDADVDAAPVAREPDDGSGHGGGSGDPVDTVPEPDTRSDSSGPGSGSDDPR